MTEHPTPDLSRRQAIKTCATLAVAATLSRHLAIADNVSTIVESSSYAAPKFTPPGAADKSDFLRRCTACGLCVEVCPTGVLVASSTEYGVANTLKPVMHFERNFCRSGCNKCTQICPTGALKPISHEQKLSHAIGKAVVNDSDCISAVNGTSCGVCARRCPVNAIFMTTNRADRETPTVDASLCIGCGACAYICPSKAFKILES